MIWLRFFIASCILQTLVGGSSAYGQAQLEHGTLACVVRLDRMNPSQPDSRGVPQQISVKAPASAFFVGDPDGTPRVFLVTAAHNLLNCESIQASHPNFNVLSIGSKAAKNFNFKPYVYFDQSEDIAVFELQDTEARKLRVDPTLSSTAGKTVGDLWQSKTVRIAQMPRGGIAASAGPIARSGLGGFPAYSCTISRYTNGGELSIPLSMIYRPNSEGPTILGTEDLAEFRRGVAKRVNSTPFLVVESMSIAAGFSGSPIMISDDYFLHRGEIIGLVLGGTPAPGVGRYVWAATSDTIRQAINVTSRANKGERLSQNWHREFEDENGAVLAGERNVHGRWITSCDLDILNSRAFSQKFRSPHSDGFSVESRVEFSPNAEGAYPFISKDEIRDRIKQLPGRAFVFRDLIFVDTCLDHVNLLTPYFEGCTFYGTRFYASVLTGATFERCRYFDTQGVEKDIREIVNQTPCPDCSAAAIIAPQFKGKYVPLFEPANLP
ncbi:MAG: hypothetical protein JWP89_5180 [Schlesneria sp.]|nr:hypothetical protein [Schlesneria sp.]